MKLGKRGVETFMSDEQILRFADEMAKHVVELMSYKGKVCTKCWQKLKNCECKK